MSTTRTLLLAATLLLPAAARADGPPPLERLLLGYEYAPDRAALEAAAEDPEAALLALLADKTRSPVVHLRALDALAHFPSLRVRRILHRLAQDRGAAVDARIHAVTALVFAFRDGALTSAVPLLGARDPALRLAAADALARYAGQAGRAAVRREAHRTKDPQVRLELRAVLVPEVPAKGVLR